MTQRHTLVLIGCGNIFETIAFNSLTFLSNLGSSDFEDLKLIRLDSTDVAVIIANEQLALLNPATTAVFTAIDQNAMNYARLEIYGRARILGFKSKTLIHPSAIVAADSKVGENCWIGAGAVVSSGVKIGNNTFIGAHTRLDYGVNISANCWLGAGSSIGNHTSIGQHVVIGADINIGSAIQIGRHCSIDIPGHYLKSLAEGTFIDALFPATAHIYTSKSSHKVFTKIEVGN